MNQDNVSHLNRDVRTPMTSGTLIGTMLTPTQRPHYNNNQTGQTPHKKFVAKGHDAQLMDAQMSRLETTLTLSSGASFKGVITRRDKFTITLQHEGGEEIFYKHAIESVLIVGIRDVQKAH